MKRAAIDRWLASEPVSELTLMAALACHLTGRAVAVRMQAPAIRTAQGWIARDERGDLVIDVKPDLLPSKRFEVLLHECAHGRLHAELIEPSASHRIEPRALPGLDPTTKAEHARPEWQASDLAARWLRLANERACEFRQYPIALRQALALLCYAKAGGVRNDPAGRESASGL